MNENELGEALLKWDARGRLPEMDPQKLVMSVLERDRRRVRGWAIGAAALWTFAAVGIPLFFYLYLTFVFPKVNWLTHEMLTHQDEAGQKELADTAQLLTQVTLKMGTVLVTGSMIALLAAAGCTIWLVFAARRATLREVNANLAEVAEQLRRMRPASGARELTAFP